MLWWRPIGDFLFSLLKIGDIRIISKGALSFPPIYIFRQLFILVWFYMYLFYRYNSILLLFILLPKSFSFALEVFVRLGSVPILTYHTSFLNIDLPSGNTRCCRLILYFPAPVWNQLLQQGANSFNMKMVLETKIWVARYAYCFLFNYFF